jgi:hypothetical protein
MHARRQIRERVRALLEARESLSGRVWINPRANFSDEMLPAVIVTAPSESIDTPFDRKDHSLSVLVEIIVASDAPADDLDGLATEVEIALSDSSLDDLVTDFRHIATAIAFDSQRRVVAGSAKLSFTCQYQTGLFDPEKIT